MVLNTIMNETALSKLLASGNPTLLLAAQIFEAAKDSEASKEEIRCAFNIADELLQTTEIPYFAPSV